MSEQKIATRGRGRPSKLDASTSGQIAGMLIAGSSVTEVAQVAGVCRRSVTTWLQRSWSRDPRDAEAAVLTQMLVRGLRAKAEIERRKSHADLRPESFD